MARGRGFLAHRDGYGRSALGRPGSRKITRITEAYGLDDNNRYQFQDLFVTRMKGRTPSGDLIADLETVGNKPTFSREPYEYGMDAQVQLTSELWER